MSSLAPPLFATSNSAKFAQASLELGSMGISVEQLRAHEGGYPEFYGKDTVEFLSDCLLSVLSRAGSQRIVMIEDTTVRINGLSHGHEDVPGQATKEWFQETDHSELLRSVRRVDPSLVAVVHSDIALHIPGHPKPVFFRSSTSGRLAERPGRPRRDPIYPWLGRNDFSQWFIPNGARVPFGTLSYERSVDFDVRRKSLLRLGDRLLEYEAIRQLSGPAVRLERSPDIAPTQLSIPLAFPQASLLVVLGEPASGKSTVGRYLAANRGFRHLEGSDLFQVICERVGIDPTLDVFERVERLFRLRGPDVVARDGVWPIVEMANQPVVYTGARTVEGVRFLKSSCRDAGIAMRVIWLSVSPQSRTARAVARARKSDVDGFGFEDRQRLERNFSGIRFGRLVADEAVDNGGSLSMLRRRVDGVVARMIEGGR